MTEMFLKTALNPNQLINSLPGWQKFKKIKKPCKFQLYSQCFQEYSAIDNSKHGSIKERLIRRFVINTFM